MRGYCKHLITCNCVLPQFKNSNPPTFHGFVVFSVLDEHGDVVPSYAQCNNCSAVHRVTEVGVSKTLPRETISALPKVEELKTLIPVGVSAILESYRCEVPTWQEVAFVFTENRWGTSVVLTREQDDEAVVGKYLLVLGKELWKVDGFSS